jgi:hypothetical protein
MGLFSAIGDWASGGGLIGALSNAAEKKKNKKAVQAVEDAAAKNRELFQGIYDTTRGDLSPYRGLGDTGVNALSDIFGPQGAAPSAPSGARPSLAPIAGGGQGVTPASGPPGGGSPAPAGPAYPGQPFSTPDSGGGNDWQAYLEANPDVLANAQQRVADGSAKSLEEVAQQHYELYGKPEGRTLPTSAVTPGQTVTPDLMNGVRPDAAPAPVYNRPQGPSAPGLPQVDWRSIEDDPGFQWETGQATRGVNAGSAARGKLRSGDAAKALQQELYGVAHSKGTDYVNRSLNLFDRAQGAYQFDANRGDQNFNTDANRGLNLYTYQTNRGDNNFDADRGYQTQRYDQNVSNLFNLTNIGANAAAGTASAGNTFATNVANGNNSVANARANAALNRPNPFQQVLQLGSQAAGAYFGGGF